MPLVKRIFKSEDLLFRVVCAVFGAHVMVVFGVETTFFEAILNPVYYKAMAGSLLIAFPVVEYTAFVSRRLDRKWDWIQKPLERSLLQALFGVIITSIITFLLASIYFYARGVNIFDTLYLRIDFPLVVSLLLVLNLLFTLQALYRHIRRAAGHKPDTTKQTTESNTLHNLIVRTGNHVISLPLEEVAYIYLQDDYRYVQAFSGRKLMVSESLEELELQLDQAAFFRANRQMIVNRGVCTGFTTIEFGKLELICKPSFHSAIIVSQRKAKDFRNWLNRHSHSTAPASYTSARRVTRAEQEGNMIRQINDV